MSEIVNVATHSFSLTQMCDQVAEQSADLGAQSAQQLTITAMPFDEQKISTVTKEDLEQDTADILVVMKRQVLVIQKAPRKVDIPLLQHSDTTVDVPVAKDAKKTPQEQRKECMTKHNEIQMDKKLRSAKFRTENKKQIVFDIESPSDLSFTVQKDTEMIHREVQGRTKINCDLRILGNTSTDLVKNHSELDTRRGAALHVE